MYGVASSTAAAAAAVVEVTVPVATAAADPAAVADEAHRAQLADFLAALGHGGEPLVTGEQARADLAVIRAVYDSARLGRPVTPSDSARVVRNVPFISRHFRAPW